MDSKRIILAAHRGDRKRCPENTMPAFIAAEKLGCDMIEMDLHMTADGELVIMHDRSAKRTAGVDRNIDEMTLAEVKELDAGALFSEEFRGTPVPTVREFCEWLSGNEIMINAKDLV
jgi:glycerophosphoryl diester phosphodiesterase